jgi:TonB family protein
VLIPASCLTGLSTEQIEAIFCHELAHVRRHDYLVSVFQSVAEALLFYHPAMWWVSKQVRRERECCCDEVAVGNGGDALAYAQALSYLEERRAAFPEFVLGANGGVLTMRIKRLLGCAEDAPSQFGALTLLAVVLTVMGSYAVSVAKAQPKPDAATSVSAIQQPPAQGDAQTGSVESQRQAMKPQYKTWLNQDVVYIITPEERAAYLKLTNDEERDDFIRNFWARRNPPGAAADTFRQEHYARIAYSNENFASDKPGWRSDRGHIYIVYGKPQSIDSHRSGGGPSGYPYEVWHYPYIPGIGDNVDLNFVDTCACGQYNLTVDQPDQGPAAANPATAKPRFALAAKIMGFDGSSPASSSAPASPAPPQTTGGIAGIIVDPTGALVPRANVTASNTDLRLTMTKTTDNTGRYLLTPLPPGRYNIEVRASGFNRLIQENVPVEPQRQVTLNLRLRVGEVSQSLTVTGRPLAAAMPPPSPQTFDAPSNRPTGPVRISAGVSAGMAISQPPPIYPDVAKASHIEGVVVLKAIISKSGAVDSLVVVGGPAQLIASALDAVKQWRYKPYLLNGEPVEVQTTININYTFEPDPSPSATAQLTSAPGSPQSEPGEPGLRRVPATKLEGNLISKVDPIYPAEAKFAGVQGSVILRATISKQGTVAGLQLVSGPPELTRSAWDAVKQWIYRPYLLNGEPIEVQTTITVNFTLGESDDPAAARSQPQAASAPRKMADGATAPLVIYQVAPEYTEKARKAKTSGVVLVNLKVDRQGLPQDVRVVRGIGNGLDKRAVEAVKQYRFKPAMKDDEPVEEALNVEINFQIF